MSKANGSHTLEVQLEEYSSQRTSEAWSTQLKRWPIYATVGGAALAMTTSAEASIISGNFNTTLNVQRIAASTKLQTFTFKDHGVPIGSFKASLAYHNVGTQHFARVSVRGPFLYDTYHGWAKPLTTHIVVSAGLSTSGQHFFAGSRLLHGQDPFSNQGAFGSESIAFAGFKLNNGDYGWIQLTWLANDAGHLHDGWPDTLQVGQWGIETTGAAIRVGDTGPLTTPEPGTAALSLLACGAAGIMAWRKRRAKTA